MTTSPERKFQIAVLLPDAALPAATGTLEGIEWLLCRKRGADRLEFLKDGTPIAWLDFRRPRFDLPGLLAIFVIGDEAECRTLQHRWNECFPAVGLGFRYLPELSPQTLADGTVTCLAAELTRERNLSGRAAIDLAVYRQEFERLQRSFARLEEYVSRHSLREPLVLFEYAAASARVSATRTTMGYSGESGMRRILQRLPLDSLGVSGVALNIQHKMPTDTSLRVRLHALENDRTYAEWAVSARDAPAGWLHLALNHAIDEPALGLVVIVELPAELDATVLGVGQPHPYEEFRARVENGESWPAPLALRVYGGLPGMRVAGSTSALRPTGAMHPAVTLVSREIYKTVHQVFPPRGDHSNFVLYDEGLGIITVHPHESCTMTVARLDLTAPAGAWRFSAQISLEHELAKPVEFALLALPRTANTNEAAFFQSLDEDSHSFSGWVGLTALQKKRISVFLPTTDGGGLAIYLLTRQAPETSADFAWARFAALEFNAPPGVHQPLPGTFVANGNTSWPAPVPPPPYVGIDGAGTTIDVEFS